MERSAERSSEATGGWEPFGPDADVPSELRVVADAALERNARDVVILDLRGLSDATDFFVVASGDSDVHTRSIAETVQERLEEAGETPSGVEGEGAGRWILLDYFDIVVHVFLPRVREFYQLEKLWGDAPRAVLQDEPV